jgi:hypothetical protein
VCEKNVRFEDLSIDSLSLLALQRYADCDAFVLNEDCKLVDADKVCAASTPATEKKIHPRALDHSPFRNLDLEEGCDAEMNSSSSGSGVPPEFAALWESGIWEYNEFAESVFSCGPTSPADSDVDDEDDEPTVPDVKVDKPEISGPKRKFDVQPDSASRKMKSSAKNAPLSRPSRSCRTEVKYAEESSDNHDEEVVEHETESD